eukprot:1847516-Rhodomonas_salina.1
MASVPWKVSHYQQPEEGSLFGNITLPVPWSLSRGFKLESQGVGPGRGSPTAYPVPVPRYYVSRVPGYAV